MEVWGNNRSVLPWDVLGRTHATLMDATSSTLDLIDKTELYRAVCKYQLRLLSWVNLLYKFLKHFISEKNRMVATPNSQCCWIVLTLNIWSPLTQMHFLAYGDNPCMYAVFVLSVHTQGNIEVLLCSFMCWYSPLPLLKIWVLILWNHWFAW